MTRMPSIVTTDWLATNLDDPKLRVVDVTTFLRQPGATNGQFRTMPHSGVELSTSGAMKADFFKQLSDVPGGVSFAINGTGMRLTLHPGPDGSGHYRFWSGRETYEEGHIPGAVYADIDEFSDPNAKLAYTAPSHDLFAAKAGALGIGAAGTRLVIYDQGVGISFWASRLWWQFRLEGFDDVAVLEGGLAKWTTEGRSTTVGAETLPAVRFEGTRRSELVASVADVEKAIGDPGQLIVDSLSPADFRGEANSYGGRGHIPGSTNVYCATHTDDQTNEVFADDVLKKRLEPIGVLDPERRVIAYCGGGIGATWNALILHHLGKTDVAVYDGSMLEWAADPTRPLET